MHPYSLSIGAWNVNGIKSQIQNKLGNNQFNEKLSKHDIVCLIETHAGPDTVIQMKGYHTFQVNRPRSTGALRNSGGLAILVKKSIKKGVKFYNSSSPELAWLKLSKEYFKLEVDIFVACVYIPPRNSTYFQKQSTDMFDILESKLAMYSSMGQIVLVGDFNSRTATEKDYISQDTSKHIPVNMCYRIDKDLGNRSNEDSKICESGKRLIEICITSELRILNGRTLGDMFGRFTCHKPWGQSAVDYVLVHHSLLKHIRYFKVHEFEGDMSDHCLISFNLQVGHKDFSKNNELNLFPLKYKWDESCKELFCNEMQSPAIQGQLSKLQGEITNDISSVDRCVGMLNGIFMSVAQRCLTKKRRRRNNRTSKKWYTRECRKLKADLKVLAKKLQSNPGDSNIRKVYFDKCKKYVKQCKHTKKEYKKNLVSKLETHQKNSKEYWTILEDLKSADNMTVTLDEYDADEWVLHYKQLYKKPVTDSTHIEDLISQLEKHEIFNELDYAIKENEIVEVVKNLKNNKATGLDLITNEMIKSSFQAVRVPLRLLFNKILNSGEYPTNWSQGYIVSLFKAGSIHDPNNYRGITIGNSLGKVFSSIMNNRFKRFLDDRDIMHDVQIGSMKGCRTTDHMFVLKSMIDKYTKSKQGTRPRKLYTAFVDFRKAFDLLWRDALYLKLLQSGVGSRFYRVIKNMYSSVKSCIKLGQHITPFFETHGGVKQGDAMSPSLFNFYINDIPNLFDSNDSPVYLGNRELSCLQYADDLVLMSQTKEGLQRCLDKLQLYCTQWKLEVNTKKTKILIFNPTGRKLQDSFLLNGYLLENVQSYTYLGVRFSSSGSFSEAIRDLCGKSQKAIFKLKRCLGSVNVKPYMQLKMFDQLIKPIATYGAEIWGLRSAKKDKQGVGKNIEAGYESLPTERLHVNFCKYVLGVHRKASNVAVFGELGREPLCYNILITIMKFWVRLLQSPSDSLLGMAYKESMELADQGLKSWVYDLREILKYFKLDDLNAQKYVDGSIISMFMAKAEDEFHSQWEARVECNSKLGVFRIIEKKFGYEEYLNDVNNFFWRRELTRLRISSHKLLIERGRYCKIERDQRICRYCNRGEIENEIHFVLNCTLYDQLREQLLKKEIEKWKSGNRMNAPNQEHIFAYLIKQGNVNTLAQYCCEANQLRT